MHSGFETAVNLLIGGELWTLLEASRPDAPLGIRLEFRMAGLGLEPGDRVTVRAGYLRVGDWTIDCRCAGRWSPCRWGEPVSGLAARLALVEGVARPRALSESADMAGAVMAALRGTDAEIGNVVRTVVGRGPGLTPAGDDVLVGVFALLTSGAAGEVGAIAAARLASAVEPLLHTTTEISGHLLRQAARGLPGRALHDLGQALGEGASHERTSTALQRVLATGATSGADASLGVAAAFRACFLNIQSAAA